MIENKSFYYHLLDKYGIYLQTCLAVEEISEYIQALIKVKRFGYPWFYKIVEEFADVEMTFNSIRVFNKEPEALDDKLKSISMINGFDNDDIFTFGKTCLWFSTYYYDEYIINNSKIIPLYDQEKNILYKGNTILNFRYSELIIKLHTIKRIYDQKTNGKFSKAIEMRIHDKIEYLLDIENIKKPEMRHDWENWVDEEYDNTMNIKLFS